MKVNHLLERIQYDSTTLFKRWSLRELASQTLLVSSSTQQQQQQQPVKDINNNNSIESNINHSSSSNNNNSNVCSELLQSVLQRLAIQHESLRIWKQSLHDTIMNQSTGIVTSYSSNQSSSTTAIATLLSSVVKRIDTIQYIHYDTYKIGYQILHNNNNIIQRYNTVDQNIIYNTFYEIRARHSKTIVSIVDIISDLRQYNNYYYLNNYNNKDNNMNHHDHEMTAENILRRRIGIQLLCDHYIGLVKRKTNNGCVSINTNIVNHVLLDAIQEAKHLVDVHLPIVPDVIILQNNNHDNTNTNTTTITCTIVQSWVHHTIVELLKNAMSSSVRYMQHCCIDTITKNTSTGSNISNIPSPVYIKCSMDDTNVYIDIIDYGTGIPNDDDNDGIHRAFMLGHTTAANQRWDRLHEQQSYASIQVPPLSSLGVGLPTSKYYIEHFHGLLTLKNNNHNENQNNIDNTNIKHHISNSDATNMTYGPGCTARIVLRKDDTILERHTPLQMYSVKT